MAAAEITELPRQLTSFEGRDVIAAKIEIPGAAGGLRDAMDFDPIELTHGERCTIVMDVECVKVRFDEAKEGDMLVRVHVLKPVEGGSSFIDRSVVAAHLDAQAEKVRLAREEAAGISRLTFETPEEEAMRMHHSNGLHRDGVVEGCPICGLESDLEEGE